MVPAVVTAAPDVPDVAEVAVPAGGRVLVVSDLHLGPSPTAASSSAAGELARVIDDWVGPGVLVLAGDVFELLSGPNLDVEIILSAHPRLKAALAAFAAAGVPERRVLFLPGTRDARLAWDERQRSKLCKLAGGEITLAVELVVETGRGPRRVRVEHGHQYDPYHAFRDQRDPNDSPLAQHLVTELLPAMAVGSPSSGEAGDSGGPGPRPWLDGWEALSDPVAFPSFVASRVAYRRVARGLRWLLAPFALALAIKVPLILSLVRRTGRTFGVHMSAHRTVVLVVAVVTDLLIVVGGLFFGARRAGAAAAGMGIGRRGRHHNDAPRDAAKALIRRGYTGLVSGHTHHPELTLFGTDAFYANTGSCTDVMEEHPARLDLPPVYLPRRHLSWLEIEAGAELHARLVHGAAELPGATRLERLAARPAADPAPARPGVVASYPQGPSWPVRPAPLLAARRVRRRAALLIAAVGLINLVSALTPPLRHRLHVLREVLPLAVPQVATVLVALSGLGLLLLARGIRKGQRRAWEVACLVLVATAALHLLKGLDPEEAVLALGVTLYLFRHRRAFRARTDRPAALRGLLVLGLGGLVATASATAALELVHRHRPRPPLGRAIWAVMGHLIGRTWGDIPGRLDDFLSPALLAVTIGLGLAAGWLLFRPVVSRRVLASDDRSRARAVVAAHGGDTLAYFALRDDKRYFFSGSSMVAYAVVGGIALVSPDPIGPVTEREQVWTAFRHFADEHAWPVAVMGAGESWLPIYRSSGMHDLYVGDEAVVDVTRFNLDGGQAKGLRQAVNRIAKYGYTVRFFDPSSLDPGLRDGLRDLMCRSRRGDVERGFSMTLGRVFDPEDHGLLLAVAFGADGAPAAFCQYVPAPDIDGWSLDLMRRGDDDAPNGLTDFVVVETIRELASRGSRGLALNFATMRAVLAGESGEGITQKVERWLLQKMGDSMQIESLWYFNAKYDPVWRPRYAVYDAPEHILPAAMAVARAESFWELPVIGRFLMPTGRD